ncbi:MAG: gfo/Idh/MocA family oxidoreductase, partial [Bacteroidetes bacterium]|nr:gfo/Idh/MocA family oxidoreductase [Bacteroidota bacterium]
KGGIGNMNFTTSVYNKNLESSMTIIAEQGTIKVGGQYMDTVLYCDVKDYTMPTLAETNPANDYGFYKGSAANHHYIIENIVDVLNKKDTIHIPAEDGLKVVEMIERMYIASRKN